MLKMDFCRGTLDKDELIRFIRTTAKPILYTYGWGWKSPTTYKKPISADEAEKIVMAESLIMANETEEYLHINALSENDMW